jgi:hypothetical protein
MCTQKEIRVMSTTFAIRGKRAILEGDLLCNETFLLEAAVKSSRDRKHNHDELEFDNPMSSLLRPLSRRIFASRRHNSFESQIGHHVPIVLIRVRRI